MAGDDLLVSNSDGSKTTALLAIDPDQDVWLLLGEDDSVLDKTIDSPRLHTLFDAEIRSLMAPLKDLPNIQAPTCPGDCPGIHTHNHSSGGLMRKPFLLAIIAVLALSGCASEGESSAGSIPDTEKTVTASAEPTETSTPTPTRTPIPSPTPSPTPTMETAELVYSCYKDRPQVFYDFHEVWAANEDVGRCEVERFPAPEEGELTTIEQKALTTAYGDEAEPTSIETLYGMCATTSGYPIDAVGTGPQARETSGAVLLCPDHPKIDAIKAGITKGMAQDGIEAAMAEDRKNGKLLASGSYLIGTEAVPGTWQSQGEKVTDCYWEVSDAQGNILANNFINVAPPFTISVPADAAGLTIEGCAFRWVSP
ncbi:hypothetical protein [Arthrobacter agilis]|uniref:hypothetical protein n=1 Tax=Arthrobacter agilis TaxID=37921 RepID=UPI00278972EB|nr:hypothetical protein [Arthrobacter agilis]MDQ0733782.1 hypothetical protein [Arthrobacter agilis]